MRKTPGIVPALAANLLCATLVSAQEVLPRTSPRQAGLAPEPLTQVTALLERAVVDGHVAGAVVGVAHRGTVPYLEAVGLRDVANGTPMSERTLFRIYSMTKAVTAVAVMMLHEEGRFELSDPVSRYLPEFERVQVRDDAGTRPPVRPPTVEHLLLHTAGLSHRSTAAYREAQVRSRDVPLQRFIENVVGVPLRFDPGDGYFYSASPTVLGRLVEVWSGQSFDRFVEERILAPLGMSDTGFWVDEEDADRLATVYETSPDGLRAFEIEEVPFTRRPALMEGSVGLVSTVPDFLRFAQMLLNDGVLGETRLLQERTVDWMTRNGLPDEILRTRRGGTGWTPASVAVVVDAAEAEPGAHEGEYRWDGSAGTEFWVDPATETILVTMWQSSPANPDRLRQRIRALVREAVGSSP